MFKEVLKIKPKLDSSDLRKMENSLNQRFKRVAKKFGRGMGKLFKGGALVGLGLAFVSKILNPLKEVQQAIDATLTKNDDLVTYSKQFGTSSGNLAKLNALGQSHGLSQNDLVYVLTKFQTAIGEQREGRRDLGLGEFTGIKDTSEAFFQFIQSLQKVDAARQNVIQKDIFGERQIIKLQDFLQADFKQDFKDLGLDRIKSSSLTAASDKLGGLGDLRDRLAAKRDLGNLLSKGEKINAKMIRELEKGKQIAQDRLDEKIQEFDELKRISNMMATFQAKLEKVGVEGLSTAIKEIPKMINSLNNTMTKINNSPLVRGMVKLKSGIGSIWGGK